MLAFSKIIYIIINKNAQMIGVKIMGIKDDAIKTIKELPDDATYEDIIEEIYIQSKINAGLRELDEGKYLAHEKVKERLSKWLS